MLLRLGFTTLFRYCYMGISLLCIGGSAISLGKDSYTWVWYLIAISNGQFITLDREKKMLYFGNGGIAVALTIVLPILFFDVIPSEVPEKYHAAIANYGMFTVIYSTSTLVNFVIRFKREVTAANKRIQEQSITMLQQAKMSTLGEMAGGVAHEINNPLAMILGHSTQLVREIKGQQTGWEKLLAKAEKIQSTVERISKSSMRFAPLPETLMKIHFRIRRYR